MARAGAKKDKLNEPKVRVQASLSSKVYQKLQERADQEKRSISAMVAWAVAAYLDGDQRSLPFKE